MLTHTGIISTALRDDADSDTGHHVKQYASAVARNYGKELDVIGHAARSPASYATHVSFGAGVVSTALHFGGFLPAYTCMRQQTQLTCTAYGGI